MTIHTLPAELLLPIFEYASLDDRPLHQISLTSTPTWTIGTYADPSTSVNISQVCARWRQLSLSDQMLWPRVPRSHESITNMYISRCPTAPLDIEIDPYLHAWGARKHQDLQELFQHISRARSLSVLCRSNMSSPNRFNPSSIVSTRPMRTFLKSFTSSAPHLAELYMDLQSKAVLHGRDNPFPIPPHMFNDESLQSLRFVKFNHVHIRQPHTFIWPNLRRIELTESRSWASPTSFVAFFSGVPLLEEFVSRNNELSRGEGSWVNATHVSDLPPLRSVTMEHLKVLKLHGPYRDMFLALATLNIPCTALVSLTLSGIWLADNQEAKMRIVHEAVQAHFAQATEDGAYFDSVAFDGRTMSASRPVQGVLSRCLPTSFTLSIPLLQYTDHDPSNDRQLLETSFAHPIFYRATSLTIQSLDKCGTSGSPHRLDSFYFDELRRIFELYAHVHTLKVIGEDVCSYVANIVLPDGQRPPNLTVLRIYGAQFTSVAAPPEANLVLAAVLLPCLLRLGETFELLHLHGCALGEKDVRMLREGLGEGRLSLVDNHSGIGGQR